MTEQMIRDAYIRIRTIDQTIPDDVLDFMKDSAIDALNSKWISVKERMPRKAGSYLAIEVEGFAVKIHKVVIADCYQNVEGLKFQDYITHWMIAPAITIKEMKNK